MLAGILVENGRARVLDYVLPAAERLGQETLRGAGLQPKPLCLVIQSGDLGQHLLEFARRLPAGFLDLGRFRGRQFQRLEFCIGDPQRLKACGVLGDERLQHLLADFFGRDHFPGIDLAVAVGVDAPLGAGGAEPAVLIGGLAGALVVAVDLAINLHAILVVRPDVDLAVVIAVEEAAQRFALRVAHQPAAAPLRALYQLNLAGIVLLRRRHDVGHAFLAGPKALEDGPRRRSVRRVQREAARREQAACHHSGNPARACHPCLLCQLVPVHGVHPSYFRQGGGLRCSRPAQAPVYRIR
jgi:hypothetical protein